MIGDSTQEEFVQPSNGGRRLPNILKMRIRRIPYEPPKRRYIRSPYDQYREAVEFVVLTDEPFQIRALSPILIVGDVRVEDVEAGGEQNIFRFLAFQIDSLKDGAPIYIGWSGDTAEDLRPTGFVYHLDNDSRSQSMS